VPVLKKELKGSLEEEGLIDLDAIKDGFVQHRVRLQAAGLLGTHRSSGSDHYPASLPAYMIQTMDASVWVGGSS
jgi:hypothetical protein